jgi:protease-4
MKQTYEQFTDRVSTGRKGKIQDVDKIARGRIFVAKQAKELGMVDEIGGINEAIADAAKKVGLKAGDYAVQVVPRPKTLSDFLNGTADDKGTGPQAQLPIRVDLKLDTEFSAALKALPPGVRSQLSRQIATIRLFNDRPVALVAPYSVKLK